MTSAKLGVKNGSTNGVADGPTYCLTENNATGGGSDHEPILDMTQDSGSPLLTYPGILSIKIR
ncbi:hypothetical protein CHS0354_007196 [Potamilus streckersoni]|uniref:Uncharacterized protein n=1 Tax=Potamilus streckersoni TaxID=2493646 RepID=A0AAE0T712_9BIVA|nr:hypothetical protein CHS0354_007196 [Potamilus streckersoni]